VGVVRRRGGEEGEEGLRPCLEVEVEAEAARRPQEQEEEEEEQRHQQLHRHRHRHLHLQLHLQRLLPLPAGLGSRRPTWRQTLRESTGRELTAHSQRRAARAGPRTAQSRLSAGIRGSGFRV